MYKDDVKCNIQIFFSAVKIATDSIGNKLIFEKIYAQNIVGTR